MPMNIARGGAKGPHDPNEATMHSNLALNPQALPSWLRKTLTPGEWSAFEKALKVFDHQRTGLERNETRREQDVFARYWDLLSAFSIRANREELDKALHLVNCDPSCTLSLNQSLELISWLLYFERVTKPSVGELCGSEIDPDVMSKAAIDVEKLSQYLASFELDVNVMLPKGQQQQQQQHQQQPLNKHPRFFEEERPAIQLKEFQATFGLDDLIDDANATKPLGPPIYVPAVNSQASLWRERSGLDLRHARPDAAGDIGDLDARLLISKGVKKVRPVKRKESFGQASEDPSIFSQAPAKEREPPREPQLHLIQCILDRMAEQSKGPPRITRIMKKKARKKTGLGVLDPNRNGNAKLRLVQRSMCQVDMTNQSDSDECRSLDEQAKAGQQHRKAVGTPSAVLPSTPPQRSPGLSTTFPHGAHAMSPSWSSTTMLLQTDVKSPPLEAPRTPLPYAEWYAQYYAEEDLTPDDSPASALPPTRRSRKKGRPPVAASRAAKGKAGKRAPASPVTNASLSHSIEETMVCPPIDGGLRCSASRVGRSAGGTSLPCQESSRVLPIVTGSGRLTSFQLQEDPPLDRCLSPVSPTSPISPMSPHTPPTNLDQLLLQVHQANRLLSSKSPLSAP
eukprot:GGOE01022747.1.p1 GENE.GGOE01022747.1~~GGOE01022747.1.p1  ORF type:complete len:624 (+),score=112.61 GGOE01022747.1:44-1915(+)